MRWGWAATGTCQLTQNDPASWPCPPPTIACWRNWWRASLWTPAISDTLMHLVHSGALPFHAVTQSNFSAPDRGTTDTLRVGNFSSPDALLTPR
jgi:hypothetical protein